MRPFYRLDLLKRCWFLNRPAILVNRSPENKTAAEQDADSSSPSTLHRAGDVRGSAGHTAGNLAALWAMPSRP